MKKFALLIFLLAILALHTGEGEVAISAPWDFKGMTLMISSLPQLISRGNEIFGMKLNRVEIRVTSTSSLPELCSAFPNTIVVPPSSYGSSPYTFLTHTLPHELSHLYFFKLSENSAVFPPWFVEGSGVLLCTDPTFWRVQRDRREIEGMLGGGKVEKNDLFFDFYNPDLPYQPLLNYLFAEEMVERIEADLGYTLKPLLQEVLKGNTFENSLFSLTGRTPEHYFKLTERAIENKSERVEKGKLLFSFYSQKFVCKGEYLISTDGKRSLDCWNFSASKKWSHFFAGTQKLTLNMNASSGETYVIASDPEGSRIYKVDPKTEQVEELSDLPARENLSLWGAIEFNSNLLVLGYSGLKSVLFAVEGERLLPLWETVGEWRRVSSDSHELRTTLFANGKEKTVKFNSDFQIVEETEETTVYSTENYRCVPGDNGYYLVFPSGDRMNFPFCPVSACALEKNQTVAYSLNGEIRGVSIK